MAMIKSHEVRKYMPMNDGGDENVHERDFEKENPAESHQLIVAKTRQRPAHPDEE